MGEWVKGQNIETAILYIHGYVKINTLQVNHSFHRVAWVAASQVYLSTEH